MAALLTSRSVADTPVISVGAWKAADTRAMLLVLLLVPLLMGITYRNLGREEVGNRYYRAYFTADFLWHTALAYELGKFSMPPRNPYLAPRPMNYYWTYFLLPATTAELAQTSESGSLGPQPYLKANAIFVAIVMLGTLFIFVRSGTTAVGPAVAAVIVTVLAASAEGSYAIVDLLWRGQSLDRLRHLNVDAVTAWSPFNGLRIDNIPRSLWYTPQHTTAVALGLVGLTIALLAGALARPVAIAGAGLALALATTMNPLIGAVCSLIYGCCVALDVFGKAGWLRILGRHSIAAAFVIAAVGWTGASRLTDGAGSALAVGFAGFSKNSPLVTLLLSLGPVLVPALGGVYFARAETARRAVIIGVTGVALGLCLLYLVRISEASWVGFRAGQILLFSIPVLLARALERLPGAHRTVVVVVILALGLPTTIVDTYNAQDIWNRQPGFGFRWTLWVTRQQQEAFAWIRANTHETDIVQMEPIVRGRDQWTLIPSFAGRRMAAGQPISLLQSPEYTERSERVRDMFAMASASDAVSIARRLRIDYVYVDRADLTAYPLGVQKFDEYPQGFERVFANDDVRVYKVH